MNFRHSESTETNHPSSEDMLTISQEIYDNFVADNTLSTPELVILPIDPLHLHAYWSVHKHSTNDSDKLVLRTFWHPNGSENIEQSKLWFDHVLDYHQGQMNIQLPVDGTRYSAVLGNRSRQHKLEVLLRSNIISIPNANATTLTHQPTTITTPSFEPKSKQDKQVAVVITHTSYDETGINTKIKNSLSRKHKPNPCSQLIHCNYESQRLVTNTSYFDETIIDALIQHNLTEKGINFKLNDKPTKAGHFAANNASGQNNLI